MGALVLAQAGDARAVDLPKIGDKPLRLDVTETSIAAQQFDARTQEGEQFQDQGYGSWLNRLNVALRWKEWTVGTRLDSSVYWLQPETRDLTNHPSESHAALVRDADTRFRNTVYPAKIWATYQSRKLEATVGDAYVQFGRGLVLSMRKIDELGIDNTVRGGKVTWSPDPFEMTLVGGLTNPSRVDEATGRALLLPRDNAADTAGPQPLFGSDRLVGAEIIAGRGLPIVLGTHAVRFTRCAPYHYDATGRVQAGTFDSPFGSCDPNDTIAWLATVPNPGPTQRASEIDNASESFEIPNIGGHGKLYLEAAVQHRHDDANPLDPHASGNALYGSLEADVGILTATIEGKSYRNFYPVAAAIDTGRASAFNNIGYSNPPTGESITQDAEFGFFNACVDGGRVRTDFRVSEAVLLYGALAYFYTRSEQNGGACDARGSTVTKVPDANAVHDDVWDGMAGTEWNFDDAKSHLYAWGEARDDSKSNGTPYYSAYEMDYDLSKYLSGPFSVELSGRNRLRKEEDLNSTAGRGTEQFWREGENYAALKVAPKWVFTGGMEYTTFAGLPTYYFNGAILYRFTTDSNLKLFAGQQRGGLKCVSGVCRIFPPFEGARAELTVRF